MEQYVVLLCMIIVRFWLHVTQGFKNTSVCLCIAQGDKSIDHVLEYLCDTQSLSTIVVITDWCQRLHGPHFDKCLSQTSALRVFRNLRERVQNTCSRMLCFAGSGARPKALPRCWAVGPFLGLPYSEFFFDLMNEHSGWKVQTATPGLSAFLAVGLRAFP